MTITQPKQLLDFICECNNINCTLPVSILDDLARRLFATGEGELLTLIADGCKVGAAGEVVEVGEGYRVVRTND